MSEDFEDSVKEATGRSRNTPELKVGSWRALVALIVSPLTTTVNYSPGCGR